MDEHEKLDDEAIAYIEAEIAEKDGIVFGVSFPVGDEACR